jgi:ERCC4-type nuclease
MIIQVDSRESKNSRDRICAQFDRLGMQWYVSKLYYGDYASVDAPLCVVERKKSASEWWSNCIAGHARFKAELERMKELGGRMTILFEDKHIAKLEDFIMTENPHSSISGERIYRISRAWADKYGIDFAFVQDKRLTGKKIVEILNNYARGQ